MSPKIKKKTKKQKKVFITIKRIVNFSIKLIVTLLYIKKKRTALQIENELLTLTKKYIAL